MKNNSISAINSTSMAPFDNPKHNDYSSVTNKKTNEVFKYKENLGYEYDVLSIDHQNRTQRRQECKLQPGKGNNWAVNCKRSQKDLTASRDSSSSGSGSGGTDGRGLRTITDFESTDDDVPTIVVRLYAALTIPKHSRGQLVYQYCPARVTKCHPHVMSLFGDEELSSRGSTGGGRRSRVSSKNHQIHTRLLLEGLFHSNKIPKKIPRKSLWSSLKCNRYEGTNSPVPFIILRSGQNSIICCYNT